MQLKPALFSIQPLQSQRKTRARRSRMGSQNSTISLMIYVDYQGKKLLHTDYTKGGSEVIVTKAKCSKIKAIVWIIQKEKSHVVEVNYMDLSDERKKHL